MSNREHIKDKVEQWASFLFNDFRSVGLFFCISQDLYVNLAELYSLSKNDSKTSAGVVLNPSDAGQCLTELKRTESFVRGLAEAVQEKLEAGCAPVHVFYAGCGPFATLVLPLTYQFTPEQLQVTILDYHQQAVDSATDLFQLLGKEAYIRQAIVDDAVTHRISNPDDVDIVLTETLQRALTQECQVPIVRNLLSQVKKTVPLIPQEIRVGGLWAEVQDGHENRAAVTADDVEMENIIVLNAETVREDSYLRSIRGRAKTRSSQTFCLQTEIDVYGDWKLRRNESGLTCPHPMEGVNFEDGETLTFEYEVGEHPGLRLKSKV